MVGTVAGEREFLTQESSFCPDKTGAAGVGVDVTTRRSALPDSPLVSGCAGLRCRAWASPSRGSFSLVRLGLRDVWLGSRGTWA